MKKKKFIVWFDGTIADNKMVSLSNPISFKDQYRVFDAENEVEDLGRSPYILRNVGYNLSNFRVAEIEIPQMNR